MSEYLPVILGSILIPVLGILGNMLGKLLNVSIDKIKNEHIQGFANIAVRWASQKLTGGNRGNEKFQKVASKISKNFKWATEDQIEEAIESAVNGLKREVGNV